MIKDVRQLGARFANSGKPKPQPQVDAVGQWPQFLTALECTVQASPADLAAFACGRSRALPSFAIERV